MLQSESGAKLRLLEATMASIADGVLILDASGNIVFMNEAARQITQWKPTPVKPTREQAADLVFLYPDGRIMLPRETPLGRALGGNTIVDFLVVYRRPDGKEVFISKSASPVSDERGNILGAVSTMRDVTESRHAELEIKRLLGEHGKQFARAETLATELQHRADELATVFENTDALLALLDREFNFVMANAAYADSCGHAREELIGRNHFELFPDPENQAIFERVRETGEPVKFHAKSFEYADQPWRGVTYWDWSLMPVKNELGKVQSLVLSLRDVTKEVQSQLEEERLLEKIDAERQLFQKVFENVTAGIAVLRGTDFVLEAANPAFRAIMPGKEMLGKRLTEIWPGLVSRGLPVLNQVFRTGEPYHANDFPFYFRRTADGVSEEAYFTIDCLPLIDHAGKLDSILVLAIETTGYVQAHGRIEELALMAHQRVSEMETIIENITDAVFVVDRKGIVVEINQAALELSGFSNKEEARLPRSRYLVKLDLRTLDGSHPPAGETIVARALRGETVRDIEVIIRNIHTGRDVFILASAAPIRDSNDNITSAVVVLSDITQIKELDRLKDQFLSIAAHELKTPVTIMKGYAQSLLKKTSDFPQPYAKVLEAIDRGADRIDGIVKDLLDITQLQAGYLDLAIEKIDLFELTGHIIDRMALTVYQHQIRLVEASQVVIEADRSRIEQVFINLIDNAIRFSPDGGAVDLELSIVGRSTIVSVRDYGVGIPKEKQGRIFERFYRAHTGTPYDYGGMGIGLYISREIVSRHGGKMWFESEEGKGSTFYFSLPVR